MVKTNHSLAIEAGIKYLSIVKGASINTWMKIWTEDAIVEFPYAPANYPKRLEGKTAIFEYYKNASMTLELREEKPWTIYPSADPTIAIAEIAMDFTILATGNNYSQDYICVLKTDTDGKILLYREYWNPLRVLNALPSGDSLLNRK